MYWGPLCTYVEKLSWMTKMYKYIKGSPSEVLLCTVGP